MSNRLAPNLTETLYSKGMTLEQVGKALGLSPAAVQWRLKQAGISRRPRGYSPKPIDLAQTDNLAYILGIMVGDGYKAKHGYHHTIDLITKDKEIAESFRKALSKIGINSWIGWKHTLYKGEVRHYYRVGANSKTLYTWLNDVNIQEFALSSPESFLRGLYEAEGNLNKSIPRISMCNELIITLAKRCLEGLGFKCSTYIHPWNKSFTVHVLGGKAALHRFISTVKPCVKNGGIPSGL